MFQVQILNKAFHFVLMPFEKAQIPLFSLSYG